MKIIYTLLLLNTLIFALSVDNPHEIDTAGKDIHDESCKSCHLSFMGEYSGYLASVYTPTLDEYATYLASIENFSVNDMETAGSDFAISNSTSSNSLFLSSSKLCLSCHDGINASDVSHQGILKIELSNSHPISVDYIEGKSGLKNKTTKIDNWNNASYINDILVNDKIECISCHSPHDKTYKNHLRSKNTGSKLCSTCHDK